MPSSISKQVSYPCPIIGNDGDYQEAMMSITYVIDKYPKKVIFKFEKPYINDQNVMNLFDNGDLGFFVEFNSAASFNLLSKELDFTDSNTAKIVLEYGELNKRVRLRFFLSSLSSLEISPELLAKDYPKSSFPAQKFDLLGKSANKWENIVHDFDPFYAEKQSIFIIQPNSQKDKKVQEIDFDSEKIKIKLPIETFKQYQKIINNSTLPLIYSSIVLPVLLEAFHAIDKFNSSSQESDDENLSLYSQRRWFQKLSNLIEDDKLQGNAFEKANKLLNQPLINLINIKFKEEQSNTIDDEEQI